MPASAAGTMIGAQGVKMGRPSGIHIRLEVSGTEIARVLVCDGRLRAS